jgi:hypothetical protein
MESWLVADPDTLQGFFGQGFHAGALPHGSNPVESVPKKTLFQALENATRNCKSKRKYGKGEHSFKILSLIDPKKVAASSPWTGRLLDELSAR